MKRRIVAERTYPFERELVWRALTEPDLLATWLMRNDFRPAVGHAFTFHTDPAPGFDGVVHCRILAMDPPRSMRWSWRGGPLDTVVAFTLEETAVAGRRGTRLIIEHTGFEGLSAVLTSFILQAGNRAIYSKRLPAVLARLAGGAPAGTAPPCRENRGPWSWLARIFAPVLRRAGQERRERG